MIKRILLIIFALALLFSFANTEQAQSQTQLTTELYATTSDTINNSNAADTTRKFIVPAGTVAKTVYMTYYKSSTAVYRTVKIDYPNIDKITKFRVRYSEADSTGTVDGYLLGNWVQLPIKAYGTVGRTISMTGGGTAWVRFESYPYKED
jgi:hypothetical protein